MKIVLSHNFAVVILLILLRPPREDYGLASLKLREGERDFGMFSIIQFQQCSMPYNKADWDNYPNTRFEIHGRIFRYADDPKDSRCDNCRPMKKLQRKRKLYF